MDRRSRKRGCLDWMDRQRFGKGIGSEEFLVVSSDSSCHISISEVGLEMADMNVCGFRGREGENRF